MGVADSSSHGDARDSKTLLIGAPLAFVSEIERALADDPAVTCPLDAILRRCQIDTAFYSDDRVHLDELLATVGIVAEPALADPLLDPDEVIRFSPMVDRGQPSVSDSPTAVAPTDERMEITGPLDREDVRLAQAVSGEPNEPTSSENNDPRLVSVTDHNEATVLDDVHDLVELVFENGGRARSPVKPAALPLSEILSFYSSGEPESSGETEGDTSRERPPTPSTTATSPPSGTAPTHPVPTRPTRPNLANPRAPLATGAAQQSAPAPDRHLDAGELRRYVLAYHDRLAATADLKFPKIAFAIPGSRDRVDLLFRARNTNDYVVCQIAPGKGSSDHVRLLLKRLEAMEDVAARQGLGLRGILISQFADAGLADELRRRSARCAYRVEWMSVDDTRAGAARL